MYCIVNQTTLQLHDLNLIVRLCIVAAHTDLILYYFLDQIRMMCFAGFSYFCIYQNRLQELM